MKVPILSSKLGANISGLTAMKVWPCEVRTSLIHANLLLYHVFNDQTFAHKQVSRMAALHQFENANFGEVKILEVHATLTLQICICSVLSYRCVTGVLINMEHPNS